MLKILLKNGIKMLMTTNKQQRQRAIAKKQKQKLQHDEYMVSEFGKVRYFLSLWVGDWILYTCNSKFYQQPVIETEKPYRKFYSEEYVANRYAKKLKEKYNEVYLTNVYDKHKKQVGYLLIGKEKKVIVTEQQPSNVIPFRKRLQA